MKRLLHSSNTIQNKTKQDQTKALSEDNRVHFWNIMLPLSNLTARSNLIIVPKQYQSPKPGDVPWSRFRSSVKIPMRKSQSAWMESWKRVSCTVKSTSKDRHEKTENIERMELVKRVLLFLVSCGALYVFGISPLAAPLRNSVMSSWLGESGFVASLSLIFLSEIGDKTFFICAILAMRLGRWISFLGTTAALGSMTILSVAIGVACSAAPEAMQTSIPIGKYLSVALLFFFGIRSLLNGLKSSSASEENEELSDAEKTVERVTNKETVLEDQQKSEEHTFQSRLRSFFVVAALIFVAEWGDRSMLTTIALGASQNPVGVALGGIAGHIIAAIIAVLGGSIISNFISEKTINVTSGILFIVFAITSSLNWT